MAYKTINPKNFITIIYGSDGNPKYLQVKEMYPDTKEIIGVRRFPLKNITKAELWKSRHDFSKGGFVLKRGTFLWYTEIPKNLSLISHPEMGKNKCSTCSKLFPSKCPKVRDLTLASSQKEKQNFEYALEDSNRIEKYNFIYAGFETFSVNSGKHALVITSCKNYDGNCR